MPTLTNPAYDEPYSMPQTNPIESQNENNFPQSNIVSNSSTVSDDSPISDKTPARQSNATITQTNWRNEPVNQSRTTSTKNESELKLIAVSKRLT